MRNKTKDFIQKAEARKGNLRVKGISPKPKEDKTFINLASFFLFLILNQILITCKILQRMKIKCSGNKSFYPKISVLQVLLLFLKVKNR